jgi:hypothetical protein
MVSSSVNADSTVRWAFACAVVNGSLAGAALSVNE